MNGWEEQPLDEMFSRKFNHFQWVESNWTESEYQHALSDSVQELLSTDRGRLEANTVC